MKKILFVLIAASYASLTFAYTDKEILDSLQSYLNAEVKKSNGAILYDQSLVIVENEFLALSSSEDGTATQAVLRETFVRRFRLHEKRDPRDPSDNYDYENCFANYTVKRVDLLAADGSTLSTTFSKKLLTSGEHATTADEILTCQKIGVKL